jgi:hypothetical protein
LVLKKSPLKKKKNLTKVEEEENSRKKGKGGKYGG